MPTAKKRINLTVEDDLFDNLKQLAEKEQTSVANVSHALLERALELKEDHYFSKIGEERLSKKAKRISHKDIWE
jgi:predicted DNA-binding protein